MVTDGLTRNRQKLRKTKLNESYMSLKTGVKENAVNGCALISEIWIIFLEILMHVPLQKYIHIGPFSKAINKLNCLVT